MRLSTLMIEGQLAPVRGRRANAMRRLGIGHAATPPIQAQKDPVHANE